MELLIMRLGDNAKEVYFSKKYMQRSIKTAVRKSLTERLKQNKISSTDYEKVLDILDKYEIMANRVYLLGN